VYQFESEDLEYGRGSLAELISYDRYSITSNNIFSAKVNDVVIFLKEKGKETQLVGTIFQKMNEVAVMEVEAHDGSGVYTVCYEDARLVQELKPSQLWSRWAAGAASVETGSDRYLVEDSFRWLMDGYKYVPGGRVQSMLGQEFADLGLEKSKLSAYNCLVLPSPKCNNLYTPIDNWLEILTVVRKEIQAMAFGCGCGLNNSTVPEGIPGPTHFTAPTFFLSHEHREHAGLTLDNFSNGIVIGHPTVPLTYELVVEDSRFGIVDALTDMVRLIYEGKHVFIDFSLLRYKGSKVYGIDGRSSGAISWMKLFDFVAGLLKKQSINVVDVSELFALIPHLISQGGQRRGALMIVLNVDHPCIIPFVTAKTVAGRLTGANLSVNLTDAYMSKVNGNDPDAVGLFDLICELSHKAAEPGILFMDRAQELSNTNYVDEIDATNPCAEEPLPPNGVCNLGHLNLPRFLVKKKNEWGIDYNSLEKAVRLGVRFGDNIISYTTYFDEDIKEQQLSSRRIGMGTMGLATVLIYLGIRYGSREAEDYVAYLNRFIATTAYEASIQLGEERGSYPDYDPDQISKTSFLNMISSGKPPRTLRNCALLTQAPTGSTGTIIDNLPGYDCSTGVEPYFSMEDYYRASRVGTTVKQEVELVRKWRLEHPGEENLPSYFVGASEITPREHVLMQAAIQKFVDASISKTINLPADATVEDVKKAFLLAYVSRCKGITVYRDGCRAGQVLASKEKDAKLEDLTMSTDVIEEYAEKDAELTFVIDGELSKLPKMKEFRKRPKILHGMTVKQSTPLGKMYMTMNTTNGIGVEEVFIQLGQVGSDIRAIVDSLGILLTLGLSERLSGLPQEEKIKWLISKLTGIKGSSPVGFGPTRVDSLPDAIGKVLKDYFDVYLTEGCILPDRYEDTLENEDAPLTVANDICPSCGAAAVRRVEGCEKCLSCGASKCG
jgi:ribonucleoside-diphosphate reductase alpha chain